MWFDLTSTTDTSNTHTADWKKLETNKDWSERVDLPCAWFLQTARLQQWETRLKVSSMHTWQKNSSTAHVIHRLIATLGAYQKKMSIATVAVLVEVELRSCTPHPNKEEKKN